MSTQAQTDYNTKKGFVAEGYDVVAYFNNEAIEGDKKFTASHDGVNYKFATEAHLKTFKANPKQYVPQYGGYCAYAIADKGKKVSIDPETFEIRNNKLYLFYNSWGINTLKKWNAEKPELLREKADKNWLQVSKK
ncbi:YHS domain-containing (seleno)protein [Lacinutrix salivirga]